MNWRSMLLVLSALAAAMLVTLPLIKPNFLVGVIYLAAHLADTMFHECGHAIFAWTMGHPAIPSILTLVGSGQASGVALMFDHSWIAQICAWAAMAYGCWRLWQGESRLLAMLAAAVSLALFALSFWYHNPVIWLYMGHGSSLLMGGFFLYRGLLDLSARSAFERWLNLFLGLFLLLDNGRFAWRLAFDDDARDDYSSITLFGASHHDFMAMSDEWFRLSVKGIAQFTVGYAIAMVLVTLALAYLRRNDYEA